MIPKTIEAKIKIVLNKCHPLQSYKCVPTMVGGYLSETVSYRLFRKYNFRKHFGISVLYRWTIYGKAICVGKLNTYPNIASLFKNRSKVGLLNTVCVGRGRGPNLVKLFGPRIRLWTCVLFLQFGIN